LGLPDEKKRAHDLGRRIITNTDQRVKVYQGSRRLPAFVRQKGFTWKCWKNSDAIARPLSITKSHGNWERYLATEKNLIQQASLVYLQR